jgi:ATP-dependent helicase/nuclease subunit A
LDYKLSGNTDIHPYRDQMEEYRSAMQSIFREKPVRCALLFADGTLKEM